MWLMLLFLILGGAKEVKAETFYTDNRGINTVYRDKVPQVAKDGGLKYSYDGNSFFPLIMYFTDLGDKGQVKSWLKLDATQSRDTLGEIKAAGFNASWPAWPFPTEAEFNYFDSMGMKILPNVSEMAWRAANNKDGWSLQRLKDTIAAVKHHSSILAWHLFDEEQGRTANDMDDDKWKLVRDAIRSVDSKRLVFANNYKADCGYLKFSDLMNVDEYVIKDGSSGLEKWVETIDKAVNCNPTLPVWMILQTYGGGSGPHWRLMPTGDQIRAQMYAAIAHGVTGLYSFLQHSPWAWKGGSATRWDQLDPEGKMQGINPQVTPDLWAVVSRSNKEIEKYKYVWLAKTSSDGYNMAFTKRFDADDKYNVPIRTILKDTGDPNKRYLLAVNISASPVRTRITMAGTAVVVNSLFDGQVISPTENSWIEDIPGYGVKLYEIFSSMPAPGACSNFVAPKCVNVGGSYTVSVTATNVSGVKFPTWDVANGQDDIVWYDGTRSGDTWSATIKQSAHSHGEIATHSYRFDFAGTPTMCGGSSIVICTTPTPTKKPTATPTKGTTKGDADNNGKVNVADFAVWKTEYLTKSGTKSDFDKNGRVTIADFAIWKTEYLRLK